MSRELELFTVGIEDGANIFEDKGKKLPLIVSLEDFPGDLGIYENGKTVNYSVISRQEFVSNMEQLINWDEEKRNAVKNVSEATEDVLAEDDGVITLWKNLKSKQRTKVLGLIDKSEQKKINSLKVGDIVYQKVGLSFHAKRVVKDEKGILCLERLTRPTYGKIGQKIPLRGIDLEEIYFPPRQLAA